MSYQVTIMDVTANAGERVRGEIYVAHMANGHPFVVPFWIINGIKPGPKLLLAAMTHGDSSFGAEAIFNVMQSIDEKKINGTIVTIPCLNPAGFEWDERHCKIDNQNMNRQWPGYSTGWFCDRVCAAISPMFEQVDACIDWHGGGHGGAINYILVKSAGDEECIKKNFDMAYAFGLEFLFSGDLGEPAAHYQGTLQDEFIKQGKACIVAEIGSAFELRIEQIKESIIGVHNCMKLFGMEEGEMVLPKKQYLLKKRMFARMGQGGLFIPIQGPECLNAIVSKGTFLYKIRNILTGQIIEEYSPPYDQNALLMIRALIGKVQPGDYGYIIGDMSSAEIKVN